MAFPVDGNVLSSADLGKGATAWTPTISGVTAGLVVYSATYQVSLGIAFFEVVLDCTGALTAASALTLTLPVDIVPVGFTSIGDAVLNPTGTRYWGKVMQGGTAHHVAVRFIGLAGSPVDITPTVPATWSARTQAVLLHFSAPLA